MYPQFTSCDLCGHSATVIEATPIYANADDLLASSISQAATEYSCRVDCPQCGTHVQVVKAVVG